MKLFSVEEAYSRFLDLQLYYSTRNAGLDELSQFFEGDQWETAPEDMEDELSAEEELRLTLNYARKSVLWHVGLLTGKAPRVDVPMPATVTPDAARRERYLRAILSSVPFRRVHRRLEVAANKYGYGVLQAVWQPETPEEDDLPTAEGSTAVKTRKVYNQMPYLFRAINPRRFYPCYRTYDTPDDFLYVFRYDPGRLVEDIEDQYGVVLAPTDWAPGVRGTCDLIELWTDEQYLLFAIACRATAEDEDEEEEVPLPVILKDEKHPYKRPPFFVLLNFVSDPDKDPTNGGSLSEVALIQGLNKHLNLVVSLLETEIATRIHPPVIYKTDEPQQDVSQIRVGAGEVIPIGMEEELDTLAWEGVPQTVAEHRNALMQAIRDFSGLPNTSLGSTGAGTSGIGMRLAYAVLEMILPLKLPERQEFLADVLSFILRITKGQLKAKDTIAFWATRELQAQLEQADISTDYFCSVQYGNLIPRNLIEAEQHIAYLFKMKIISHRTALELLEEVTDPEAELKRIKAENQDPVLSPEVAMQIQQLKGGPPQQPGKPELPGAGLKNDAAPPVPTSPAMPTQQNAPFLSRGQVPNQAQMTPGSQGVNIGPGPGGVM